MLIVQPNKYKKLKNEGKGNWAGDKCEGQPKWEGWSCLAKQLTEDVIHVLIFDIVLSNMCLQLKNVNSQTGFSNGSVISYSNVGIYTGHGHFWFSR